MKKLLNTLFVTTEEAYVHKIRETVAVDIDRKTALRLPLISLSDIYCFGHVNVSPYLMQHCAELGVGIAFFSSYGKFMARVQGTVKGNVLLRREQYRMADDPERTADIARYVIGAKIANSRTVLQRAMRSNTGNSTDETLGTAIRKLSSSLNRLAMKDELDMIRGIEGEAASYYFDAFDNMIVRQKQDFSFSGRNRRPPQDPVNALLSFVYAIMLQDCVAALEGVGLDPFVGFLHRDKPGRHSLALDMQEEFRSVLADRLVLSLINLQQVKAKDFTVSESGAVLLGDKLIKLVLSEYQKRKQEEILHPVIKEKVKIGLLFHVQAMLLARHCRGDMEYYPAFIWR